MNLFTINFHSYSKYITKRNIIDLQCRAGEQSGMKFVDPVNRQSVHLSDWLATGALAPPCGQFCFMWAIAAVIYRQLGCQLIYSKFLQCIFNICQFTLL